MTSDNLHNLINQTHKQALKQALLAEFVVSSTKISILKIMAQKIHWKLSIPIISTGLVAAAVFTLYNPAKPHSFLDSVKVAYAKEAEQVNNADLVHHTKVLTHTIGGWSTETENNMTDNYVTMERWDSQTKATVITNDNTTGKEIGHVVMTYDAKDNDPFKQSDNMPTTTYDLPANVPEFQGELAANGKVTMCTSGPSDVTALQPANLVMADISQLPESERIQKIQELINSNQVEDLGDKAGVHGFKANMEEYYFDSTTFKLKKHVVYPILPQDLPAGAPPVPAIAQQPMVEEYVIDEYIPKDQVDTNIWSTDNLKLVPDGMTPEIRQMMQDLKNKPAGCYNEKGEPVENTMQVEPVDGNGQATSGMIMFSMEAGSAEAGATVSGDTLDVLPQTEVQVSNSGVMVTATTQQ